MILVDGLRYISLPTRPYAGNGLGRLLNMSDYCRAASLLTLGGKHGLKKPDAIIVSSPHPFAIFPASRLARRYGAKLVFEVRDIWPLSITEINGTSCLHPFVLLSHFAERFAYRKSDVVASLMGGAEPHMRARGLAPGKFVYVPNGVETTTPVKPLVPESPSGGAALERIQAWKAEGRVVIIHPGSQGVPNGLDRLLDACGLLNSAGKSKQYAVLLVGNGNMTPQLIEQARRMGLDNVAFVDTVPKAEALWLTNQADIGYAGARNHGSVYRYGISFNKIMDFMEAGLPVVLPLSAANDPISASGCGIVTGSDEPTDIAAAITTLVETPAEERTAMGERGKKFVKTEYDYQRLAARYIDAIFPSLNYSFEASPRKSS